MGKVKEYLILQEEKELYQVKENKTNLTFNAEVSKEIETFIKAIMPESGFYWLAQIGKIKNTLKYTNIEDYIKALSYYIHIQENLYIMPFSFDGWTTKEHAIKCKCVFVDIDHPKENLDTLDKIEKAYKTEFNYAHPSFIVSSGHGLHFYFCIPEIDLKNEKHLKHRQEIIEKLIYIYNADVHCKDIPRKMRCPLSFNCKDEESIKTRIIYSNENLVYTIPQLLNLDIDKYLIDKYIKDQWQAIADKRKATRQKNGTIKTTNKDKKTHKIVGKFDLNCDLEYETSFNRFRPLENRVKNLHNYFVRHSGNIKGNRNNFIFIYIETLKALNKSQEETTKILYKYFGNTTFENEMLNFIDIHYKDENIYKFSNEKIAELLEFDEDDYKYSFGLFDEDSKKIYRKNINKRTSERRKAQREEKNNKKGIEQFIKDNIDMPENDLATLCDISTRTVRRYKRKIKDSN